MADTERDRLIIAEISGVTARHVPLSGQYPNGEAAAIAEVRAVARGRADLLAEFAGVRLGLSLTNPVDQLAAQMVAHASLAARAGADMDLVARWIPVGVKGRGDPGQPPAAPLIAAATHPVASICTCTALRSLGRGHAAHRYRRRLPGVPHLAPGHVHHRWQSPVAVRG
jgi:hypothetical protein